MCMIDEMYCFSLAANLNEGESVNSKYHERERETFARLPWDHSTIELIATEIVHVLR